jgi:hypothetical protein
MSTPHATLEFTDVGNGHMTINLLIDGKNLKPQEVARSTLSPAQMIAAKIMTDLHHRAAMANALLNPEKH